MKKLTAYEGHSFTDLRMVDLLAWSTAIYSAGLATSQLLRQWPSWSRCQNTHARYEVNAELHRMPTAGGQYHWTYLLAPQSSRKFISYVTGINVKKLLLSKSWHFSGWQTVVAWQAAVASSSYLGGTILQGLLVLNYPEYGFQRWHGTLLLYALVAIGVFSNTFLARYLPKIEGAILGFHVAGIFVIIVPLIYLSPRWAADDVFTQFLSLGGYKNDGLAFFIGLVTTVFAFVGKFESLDNIKLTQPCHQVPMEQYTCARRSTMLLQSYLVL